MFDPPPMRQGTMLNFSEDTASQLPRVRLSALKVGEFFLLPTKKPGQGAGYTKYVVQIGGSALAIARSTTQAERDKSKDPPKWPIWIAKEIARNPDLDGEAGVSVCDEAFGN